MMNSQQVKKLEEYEMNIGKPLRTIYVPEPERVKPIPAPGWPQRKKRPNLIPAPVWPRPEKVETEKETA